MPKEIPILFSTQMVQAILEGRKTETRRMVKLHKKIDNPKFGYTCFTGEREISVRGVHENGQYGESFIKSPYGMRGDILWVRENWAVHYSYDHLPPRDFKTWTPPNGFAYVADGKPGWAGKTRPNIFLIIEAARIWLEVVEVTVERLQDITPKGAVAEGIERVNDGGHMMYRHYLKDKYGPSPVHSFETLWSKINGTESWTANPWVWVIKFKVLSTTGKPATLTTQNSKLTTSL